MNLAPVLAASLVLLPVSAETEDDDIETVLKEATSALRKGTFAERHRLVREVSELQEPDPQAPMAAIAEVLASAADSEDAVLRDMALRALVAGRHQGTAIEAALEAVDRTKADAKMLDETFRAIAKNKAPEDLGPMARTVLYLPTAVQIAASFDDVGAPDEALMRVLDVRDALMTSPGEDNRAELVREFRMRLEELARSRESGVLGGYLFGVGGIVMNVWAFATLALTLAPDKEELLRIFTAMGPISNFIRSFLDHKGRRVGQEFGYGAAEQWVRMQKNPQLERLWKLLGVNPEVSNAQQRA